jgi:endonuclease III
MKEIFTDTKFDRTPAELQQYLLTCILSAGKQADDVKYKVNAITEGVPDGMLPCDFLLAKEDLEGFLRSKRTGMYKRLLQAIPRIAQFDLRTVTIEELQAVKGVGPKTSRLFLIRSRRDAPHAAIDTHTLKFLRDHRIADVPDKSPSTECEYLRLEAELLRLYSAEFPDRSPAEADAIVWNSYRT